MTKDRKNYHKRILALGGGKGGIGKSVIASNMALSFIRHGKKVVIVNLDLGSSNTSTILGIKSTKVNITNFIDGKINDINKAVIKTCYENLGIIQGSSGFFETANLKFAQRQKIIRNLRKIDADYILVDLGAGFSLNTLDFFNSSDEKLLIFTPEPTSIKDVYSFIKCAIYRKLARTFCKFGEANFVIENTVSLNGDGIVKKMNDLISNLYDIDKDFCNIAVNMLNRYRPKLIMNIVNDQNELAYVDKIKDVSKKFLNIDAEFIGFINADRSVKMSVKKMTPLVIKYPFCEASKNINFICKKLIEEEKNKAKAFSKIQEINSYEKYLFNMNSKKYYDIIKKIPIYNNTITEVKCKECGEEHFYLPYQYKTGIITCKACGRHMYLREIYYSLNERSKSILINDEVKSSLF
jgi:flagellar biosynthesis protein FlhG